MIKYVCLVCCVSKEEPQTHVISVRPKNRRHALFLIFGELNCSVLCPDTIAQATHAELVCNPEVHKKEKKKKKRMKKNHITISLRKMTCSG